MLPDELPLRRAHDIGVSLQNTVEAMTEVERAFVHIDFETAHYPAHGERARASRERAERERKKREEKRGNGGGAPPNAGAAS